MEMEEPKTTTHRFWEVDTVRGIAVVLMIIYHFIFDLAYFGAYSGNMLSRPWQTFARSIGSTFIFVMGISLSLRHNRLEPKLGQKQLFQKYLLRGAKLLSWGMVITIVTYFVVGYGFVVFGILHLLGLSTILAYPFLRSRWASLSGGLAVIGLGVYVNGFVSPAPWLIWLGVKQFRRYMVDYYPIIPWFGLALLGVFVGLTLYPRGIRRFALPDLSHIAPIRALTYLGRHSLLIYLIHQPILLAILLLVGIASL
ncbi:heparan-alpha-glucosaminide N-acetyltransferase [Chloroflexota bacterium]